MFNLSLLTSLIFMLSHTSDSGLGIFQNHQDVGKVKLKGKVVYDVSSQAYTVTGGGKNMWFDSDEFHFVYKKVKGDFKVSAKVEFLGEGVDPHRKLGWIVKNDLEGNSPHVNATVHGDGLTSLQYRLNTGDETLEKVSKNKAPNEITLERKGDTYYMTTSKNGADLETVELVHNGLGKKVYVGIYACSHNEDVLEIARYSNVVIE